MLQWSQWRKWDNIYFTACPTIMTWREHGYTESWTRLMWQKWGQLYEFQAVTNIKEENPGPIPPNNQDLSLQCTEVEPDKYEENEVTDLKVEKHALDRSCANTIPVLKGEHLLLHSPTYAKETTKCKTIKKCRTSTTNENDSTQPTPKQGTLFHPTNITIRLVTTSTVIGHTLQNFNRPFTLYLLS